MNTLQSLEDILKKEKDAMYLLNSQDLTPVPLLSI